MEIQEDVKTFPAEEQQEYIVPPGNQDMTPNQVLDAYHAALAEHKLPFRQAIKTYARACIWITMCGLLVMQDQMDNNLHNSVQSAPSFQKSFGKRLPGKKASYQLSPPQQLALSYGSQCGHMVGLAIQGWLVDRLGNRYSIIGGLICVLPTTAILFFAKNFGMCVAGATIQQGLTGFIANTAPAFAIEYAPFALRSYAVVFVHVCEIFGNLFGSCIEQHYANTTTEWGWRLPYAIEWAFPLPLIIAVFLAPESPWWLVRKGRHDRALKELGRLNNGQPNDEETLALIQHTVQLEKQLKFGSKYIDAFKGTNLRRTEVSFMTNMANYLVGFGLKGSTYFMEQAGLSASNAFSLTCGQYGLGICSTSISIYLFSTGVGRRTIWFIGGTGVALILMIVGSLALVPNQTNAIIWPQGVLLLFHFFFINLSFGPLSFLITTEVGSVQLRRKTIALGRIGYDVAAIVGGTVSPYLLNPTAANLKGKAAWIPFGITLGLLVYGYFRIPEMSGRNSEEIDILFANKVPARQFKGYVINTAEEFGVTDEKAVDTSRVAQEHQEATAYLSEV